jgi:accessory gene regulator B
MPISEKIAQKIAYELKLDKDKTEVIAYGAFAFFQIIFSLILVIIFGIIFGVLIEALILSFSLSILRKSSGGVHASNPNICLIIGTVVTIGMAIIIVHIGSSFNFISAIALGGLCFIWSYYIMLKYAPVDSKAKPINKKEKRESLKKKSIMVLTSYLVIVVAMLTGYYLTSNNSYLIYALCIYGGFTWQAFNLTIIGHKIMNKIDRLLSKFII